MIKLAILSLYLMLLAACAPSPTPVLIPAGPTAVVTPGANSTPGTTPAARRQPPTLAPSSTTVPLNSATPTPPLSVTATDAALAPTSTPSETSTPTPTAAPTDIVPVISNFNITPATTQRIGDRITMAWQAAGEQAAICPLDGPSGPVERLCVNVPLSGTRSLGVDESMLSYVGFLLRVTAGATQTSAGVTVRFQCQGLRDWFFPRPPARCPAAPVQTSEAAAQPFEHGLMIWTKTPDTFYVFFKGGDPQLLELASHVHLKPGASPDHRVGGEPPGRIDPVSGFGMLWRGEFEEFSNVRARLGWGLLPEAAYISAFQCELDNYNCYLRVLDNKILLLHPDSTARVHYAWQEWP